MGNKLKEGQKISKKSLEKSGWKYIMPCCGYEIYGKEKLRVLYDLKERKIFATYVFYPQST